MEELYHITDPINVEAIQREGLKAHAGKIFLFEDISIKPVWYRKPYCVADHIALNQVCLKEFAMFKVSMDGIEKPLIQDDVAEICSKWQWYVEQDRIAPEYIEYVGKYKTKKPVMIW